MLWNEKYRPKSFDDISSHEEILTILKAYSIKNLPNLIIYGNEGHNKKTILYCFLSHLYGKYPEPRQRTIDVKISSTTINVSYIEYNEIVEISPADYGYRDKIVIQTIIKEMAQTKPILSMFGAKANSLKTIIINGAENLTRDAQAALRRTMEIYSDHIRIFLVTKQISKLIDPIKSRCLFLRLRGFYENELTTILNFILKKEDHIPDKESLDDAILLSKGNCKRAISNIELYCHNREEEMNKRSKVELKEHKLEWEIEIINLAKMIRERFSVDTLSLIRKLFYSLLTSCLEPELIILLLTKSLCETSIENTKILTDLAIQYENRVRNGSKPLLHLEAFSASVMVIFNQKRF